MAEGGGTVGCGDLPTLPHQFVGEVCAWCGVSEREPLIAMRWGDIPPWMEQHGDWCDEDVDDSEYEANAYPLYRVRPPFKLNRLPLDVTLDGDVDYAEVELVPYVEGDDTPQSGRADA